MTTGRLEVLRGQYDLIWALAEYHLARTSTEALLWEPATGCWTVRRGADGMWRPDWVEPEPDPPPVPTAAWVSWHLGWWWSTTIEHLLGRRPPRREDVVWPGDAESTRVWLRTLHEAWCEILDGLTGEALDTESGFPWPAGSGRTTADTVAWAHAELMKNVSELGQLLLLHRADCSGP